MPQSYQQQLAAIILRFYPLSVLSTLDQSSLSFVIIPPQFLQGGVRGLIPQKHPHPHLHPTPPLPLLPILVAAS